MIRFCSADEIAAALVFACKLTGDDPEHVLAKCPDYNPRGRVIALAALDQVCMGTRPDDTLRLLGRRGTRPASLVLKTVRACAWWREDWVVEVRDHLRGLIAPVRGDSCKQPRKYKPSEPNDAGVRPAPPCTPIATRSILAHGKGRIVDHNISGTVHLGEPDPSRSALAQRLAGMDRKPPRHSGISLGGPGRRGTA